MPAPGGTLALDVSLTTGWGYGVLGEKPIWGHWSLGKMVDRHKAFGRLYDHILDAITFHHPSCIAYEAPLPANRQSQDQIGRLLLGCCGVVELAALHGEVQCFEQPCNQARKAVLGKCPTGGAAKIKPVIIDWAKRRGWDVGTQDDEADALLLLCYAVTIRDTTGRAHFNRHGPEL